MANAETTEPRSFDLGLFSTYQRTPIVLRVPTPGPPGMDTYPVKDQLTSTLVASFGVHRHLALFAAMPWTSYQTGTGNGGLTGREPLPLATLRDPRVGLASSLVRPTDDRPFAAAFLFDVQLPTSSTSDFAGERGVVFAPSIVGQARFAQRFLVGVELDGRLRPISRTFVGQRQGNQLLAGIGVSVDVVRDLFALGVEGRAMLGFSARRSSRTAPDAPGENVVGGEWLAFVRSAVPGPFGVLVGGGGGLPLDDFLGVPTARFVLALDYSPGATKPAKTMPAAQSTEQPPPSQPAVQPPLAATADPRVAPMKTESDEPDASVAASLPPSTDPRPDRTCSLRCTADPAAPLTATEEAALTKGVQRWFDDLRACFAGGTRPSVLIWFAKGGVFADVTIDEGGDSTCTAAHRERLPRMSVSHSALVRCEDVCP